MNGTQDFTFPTPQLVRKVNKQSVLSRYSICTISKIYGEQRWLLLAKDLELASIFVFNADIAPI